MLILGIDTATQIASVGITRGEEVIAEVSNRATSNHTETLLPLIADVLSQANVSLRDVAGVGVVCVLGADPDVGPAPRRQLAAPEAVAPVRDQRVTTGMA